MFMIKLKLINDERKLISIKGQKGCDAYHTDTLCSIQDNDSCYKEDYENCTSTAVDRCTVDVFACNEARQFDYCGLDGDTCDGEQSDTCGPRYVDDGSY